MKRISIALLVSGLFVLCLSSLWAQPRREQGAEFFAGYALNRMDYGGFIEDANWYGSKDTVNFNGFDVTFDKYLVHTSATDTIGIAVDVGGYFGKPKVSVSGDNLRIYTATVGPQFTNRSHKYLQPFVRAMFGVSYIDGDFGAGIENDLGFAFIGGAEAWT